MDKIRRRWLGLGVVSLGVALIIVDSTIVNVAIPSIIGEIGMTSTQAQWVLEIYTLVFAALLLVFGRLADRFGRRRLFALGVTLFAFSSVLAAIAPNGDLLIAARAVQGVGGAMMLPTSLSLLNAEFRGRERALAFGVWGATIGGMAAVGPLLGGWLTTEFSWRWAFGINIPLGLIVLLGLFAFVSESRDAAIVPGTDIPGALLSIAGFGALVFGLIEGRTYGWWTSASTLTLAGWTWPWTLSPVPVAFAIGIACLVGFIAVELSRNRRDKVSILDLSLFRIPSFRNGNITAAIVSLGEFGLIFALPLWLQNALGYSAFQTGLVLLALAGGSFLASGLVPLVAHRLGPIAAVRIGLILEILGLAGLGLLLRPDSTWALVAPLLGVYGVGVGFATSQLTGVVLADVPVDRSGQGSGTQSTSRQVGSAFGIAILGTILFSVLGAQFNTSLADQNVPAAERARLVEAVKSTAGSVIPQWSGQPETAGVATLARDALTVATKDAALTAAGFLLIGLIASASIGVGRGEPSSAGSGEDRRRRSRPRPSSDPLGPASEDVPAGQLAVQGRAGL